MRMSGITRALIQAIKRNKDRFPQRFLFSIIKSRSYELRAASTDSNNWLWKIYKLKEEAIYAK